jgi:hypothetical protein
LFAKLRTSDGAAVLSFRAGGTEPTGMAFDGANVWVANSGFRTVSKF